MAFRYNGYYDISFKLKTGAKTNLKEYASTFFNTYKEYKIPDNFKRVVVGFSSYRHPCFCGIAFYDKQGTKLLSLG